MRVRRWHLGAAVAICACGCVTGINQDTIRLQTFPAFEQYDRIRKVAVIPFMEYFVTRGETKTIMGIPERITRDNGRILCDIFTAELRKRASFKVVGPEAVAQFHMKRGEKIAGILLKKDILRVGAALRADALVMGEVDKCSTYRYRQHNNSKVSLRVRMADTATGESFWQGGIVIDDMGLPHEVATRGITLLLDQLASKTRAARPKKDDSMRRLFKQ